MSGWNTYRPTQSKSTLPESVLKRLDVSSAIEQTNRGPDLTNTLVDPYSDLVDRRKHLCWGGMAIPLADANLNFLVAGVPGTGKTVTIRRLLHSIFVDQSFGNNRVVLYDPKSEFYPMIRGCGFSEAETVILNPFDDRAFGWNLAEDFTSPADAMQLASTIIPENKHASTPFFRNASVVILAAVIDLLSSMYPGKWRLYDVVTYCISMSETRKLLDTNRGKSQYAVSALNFFEGSDQTILNVFSELNTHVSVLLPIAALWQHSLNEGRSFSLRNFLEADHTAVILGASQQFNVPLTMLNRLLIERLSQLLLDQPPAQGNHSNENRTWLVLDELRQLDKIDGLVRFVTMGRDRGVCAIFGFQDYPALQDAIGKEVAHELVSCCRHKLFLRLDNESAKWASDIIGKQEITRVNLSHSRGVAFGVNQGQSVTSGTSTNVTESTGTSWGNSSSSNGSASYYGQSTSSSDSRGSHQSQSQSIGVSGTFSGGVSISHDVRERDVVLASSISNLPSLKYDGGLHGYAVDPGSGTTSPTVCRIEIPSSELFQYLLGTDDVPFEAAPKIKQDLTKAPKHELRLDGNY
jgi:hypothetical protein